MAVAIKNLGFSNIKIYNGGLKDWKRAGYPIESRQPLADFPEKSITPEALFKTMEAAGKHHCVDENQEPLVTIVDFRTEWFLEREAPFPTIKTECRTIRLLLDDFINPEKLSQIPGKGLVVVISETGNRDWAALSYLSQHGYTNVVGLKFGMRGWIKADLPVEMYQTTGKAIENKID